MAGGKRPGAGRPKGSSNRPQIRDHFTDDDVKEVVEMLKENMAGDMTVLKFVAEQLFGKAPQAFSNSKELIELVASIL